MAWSTPRTWVTSETVTAAIMNAHVRDQFRETSPFTVTTAGDLSYADAANSMNSRVAIGAAHGMLVSTGSVPVWRIPAFDSDAASNSDTSATFIPLSGDWGFTGDVEVTVTTGTLAVVLMHATLENDTAGALTFLSYAVSGATTAAADANEGIIFESSAASDRANFGGFYMPTLTAGSNTFTLQAKVGSGTGTIGKPRIGVIPL